MKREAGWLLAVAFLTSNISISSSFICSKTALAEILPLGIQSFLWELPWSSAFPPDSWMSSVLQGKKNCVWVWLVAAVLDLGGWFLDMENIYWGQLWRGCSSGRSHVDYSAGGRGTEAPLVEEVWTGEECARRNLFFS